MKSKTNNCSFDSKSSIVEKFSFLKQSFSKKSDKLVIGSPEQSFIDLKLEPTDQVNKLETLNSPGK